MTMFQNILVATDGSSAGLTATAYAGQLSTTFAAPVTLVPLAEMHSGSVLTRDRDAARHIATEAARVHADVIVLGLERRRLAHHLMRRGLRSELARSTHLAVMVPPATPASATKPVPTRRPVTVLKKRLQHV
jgi:nucleotide-binding universal stress UspA family protein